MVPNLTGALHSPIPLLSSTSSRDFLLLLRWKCNPSRWAGKFMSSHIVHLHLASLDFSNFFREFFFFFCFLFQATWQTASIAATCLFCVTWVSQHALGCCSFPRMAANRR